MTRTGYPNPCHSLIWHIPTTICLHPADALKTPNFSWVIYRDIRVFLFRVFCTSPGHVLHFCICMAYFSRTFTHQIIHVHPTDALEILHFSSVIYLDTRVVSLRFSAHPWDMYCFFIQAIYPPIYLATSCRCSENYIFFPNIYLDTNSVFSQDIYLNTMSLFLVILLPPYLKSDALENLAFSLAIYKDSRVASLQLSIGPNHYL